MMIKEDEAQKYYIAKCEGKLVKKCAEQETKRTYQ